VGEPAVDALAAVFKKTDVAGLSPKGQSVLGHFPEYKQLGDSLDARTFSIPESAWNKNVGGRALGGKSEIS
jgi:hypothetical protein